MLANVTCSLNEKMQQSHWTLDKKQQQKLNKAQEYAFQQC